MADKTEKATPKKKSESRDKGQVAKSNDLGGAAVLLGGIVALGVFGPKMLELLQQLLITNLTAAANPAARSAPGLADLIKNAYVAGAKAVLPITLVCALAAAVIMTAQVGLKVTPKAIKPDLKKLNPISGAKQVFGMNALVELAKNLAKVGIVGVVSFLIVAPQVREAGTLVGMEPQTMAVGLLGSIMKLAKWAAAAYFIIGAADYVWQKHKMDKSMKMDKQEVKDEYKQAELPPEVRQAVKRRQMMASRARMMAAVPDADVIVTNPTHYAVALKYSTDFAAPQVVAKGQDLIAKKIREAARAHGVPIVPDPPLARALHASVEIGDHIPEEQYEAVAQVLAFVYRTAQRAA